MVNIKMDSDIDEAIEWLEQISPNWTKHDYPSKYYANDFMLNRVNSELFSKETMRPGFVSGEKEITDTDLKYSFLKHFIELKPKYNNKFEKLVKEEIGCDQFDIYCNTIEDWSDGVRRNSIRIKSLKNTIYRFCIKNGQQFYCDEKELDKIKKGKINNEELTLESIEKIINIIAEIIEELLDEVQYIEGPDFYGNLGIKYLDLHRGINIEEIKNFIHIYEEKKYYYELYALNSYSLSLGVAEKFANINRDYKNKNKKKYNLILSSSYNSFYKRVLASSMINKELNIKQFELLTFPVEKCYLNFEGFNDNVYDFRIDRKHKEYIGGIEQEFMEKYYIENEEI